MPADPAAKRIAAEDESASDVAPALGVTRSFGGRAWRLRPCDEETVRQLRFSGIDAVLSHLLAARGVSPAEAERFLEPRLKDLLPEPHSFAQMACAIGRLATAIEAHEPIAVFGDYDVDGACSSALLLRFLRSVGCDPILYIPDRLTEGYGPSPTAMKRLKDRGAKLVLTLDCGAAAHGACAAARECGLDILIIDHHAVEANPSAFAHVNPNGPDDTSGHNFVCAAGLAFIFLVGVQRELRQRGWFASEGIDEFDLLDELDLVALATVADVVPLKGVNRAFVRQGLKVLERLKRPGLASLARLASAIPPYSAYHLGFVFGPRINAGGRVGRCDLGARLLATDDGGEAESLALDLDLHNRERQAIEADILDAANAMALAQADDPFVLAVGDRWHPGVVGIVAGRLKDRFDKPVLAAGFETTDPDAIARGSARSVPGVDLGAIIRRGVEAGILESGGGHAMAAGFSVRRCRLDAFREFLVHAIEPQRGLIAAAGQLEIDAIVSTSAATLALLSHIERAGPFGAGNPEPLFLMPDMLVAYADRVGTNHVRFRLTGRDGNGLGGIAFRAADTELGTALLKSRGSRVHAAGRLKRDAYNGAPRVQLHLVDAAPAGA